MLDDPRIKRILKRYPKGENLSDAFIDVSSLGDAELQKACRLYGENFLESPRELDGYALTHLSQRMGISFDSNYFDFFLHAYVRSEFRSAYSDDPTVTWKPAPENGPPERIPRPSGTRWRSVRPKDGEETWEAWEFAENDEKS
jgi:hypothetical protein